MSPFSLVHNEGIESLLTSHNFIFILLDTFQQQKTNYKSYVYRYELQIKIEVKVIFSVVKTSAVPKKSQKKSWKR